MKIHAAMLSLLVVLAAGLGSGCAWLRGVPVTRTCGKVTVVGTRSVEDADALAALVQTQWANNAELLGPKPMPAVRLVLVGGKGELRKLLKRHGQAVSSSWISAAYPVADRWEVAITRRWTTASLHRSLRHELSHVALGCRVRGAPMWLHEGLALMAEAASDGGVHAASRRRVGKKPVPIRELLLKSDPRTFRRDDYAQSWALVYRLVHLEKDGRGRLRNYLRNYQYSGDHLQQFEDAFGIKP